MCLKCGDLISHGLIEQTRFNALKEAGLLDKVPGLPCFPIENTKQNLQLVETSTRIPSFKDTLGLRGLVNLGSTCFMSSVLQTIIHNPYIKHYYLSGSHAQSKCPKSQSGCMSCCLNQIFQDFYTNPTLSAYGLTSFVEAAWKVKRSLAGYSEQDAHEFWQFLVHQIHKNDTSSSKYTKNKESTPLTDKQTTQNDSTKCDCIIHRTFLGALQSTLTCTECGSSRTIQDPMLDISLEIQDKIGDEKVSLEDLHSCFKKYTRIEELDVLYDCSSCQKRTKVTKSLKLKKLPPVLSIQLKRFEHIGVSSKIDYHIDTPSVLDVKDYISESINDQITTYELFGIVCHIGNVNTGHYIAYVKIRNGIWLKFDDAIVTRVSEATVKQVNGYMLFYCARDFS